MPLRDHGRDPVADDRDHVAVVGDVRLVAEPAVARDHHGASFLVLARNRDVEDPIQAVDNALEAAALLRIE